MPSPRPFSLLSVLALGLVLQRGVRAQITSNATCLSNWRDLYNSKGQSPCLVGAYLGGACNGGQYDVGALEDSQHYIGPTALIANGCLCSTVMYSLMGACSTCQNATIITWSAWTANCPEVFVQAFPEDIPQDTAVPGWAYDPIPTNGTFDVNQALLDNSPESTATIIQSTNTGTRSSSGPSASSSSSVSGGSSNDDGGTNTGAIAGGVVGGVVGVALIALLGFFLYRRNQKNKTRSGGSGVQANLTGGSYNGGLSHKDEYTPVPYTPYAYDTHASTPGVAGVGAGGMAMGGMGMGSPSPMTQQKLYDPNDPSTFPTTPPPVSINNQSTGQSGSGQSYVPSFPQPQHSPSLQTSQTSNQGMYRGVAEV